MATNRIDMLRTMIESDPSNSFARYGLALEYVRGGDLTAARTAFEELTALDPDYVPTYFHFGQTLEKLGDIEDARRIYRTGIAAATRKGDSHTRNEIEAALDLLPS